MIQLNYRDSRPIYEQVKDGFRKLIVQKILAVDEKLPSVREMASSLAINPNTIQKAYRELEQEGYLYTISGKGSFVVGVPEVENRRKQELLHKLDEIVEELVWLNVSVEEICGRVKERRGEKDDTGERNL